MHRHITTPGSVAHPGASGAQYAMREAIWVAQKRGLRDGRFPTSRLCRRQCGSMSCRDTTKTKDNKKVTRTACWIMHTHRECSGMASQGLKVREFAAGKHQKSPPALCVSSSSVTKCRTNDPPGFFPAEGEDIYGSGREVVCSHRPCDGRASSPKPAFFEIREATDLAAKQQLLLLKKQALAAIKNRTVVQPRGPNGDVLAPGTGSGQEGLAAAESPSSGTGTLDNGARGYEAELPADSGSSGPSVETVEISTTTAHAAAPAGVLGPAEPFLEETSTATAHEAAPAGVLGPAEPFLEETSTATAHEAAPTTATGVTGSALVAAGTAVDVKSSGRLRHRAAMLEGSEFLSGRSNVDDVNRGGRVKAVSIAQSPPTARPPSFGTGAMLALQAAAVVLLVFLLRRRCCIRASS